MSILSKFFQRRQEEKPQSELKNQQNSAISSIFSIPFQLPTAKDSKVKNDKIEPRISAGKKREDSQEQEEIQQITESTKKSKKIKKPANSHQQTSLANEGQSSKKQINKNQQLPVRNKKKSKKQQVVQQEQNQNKDVEQSNAQKQFEPQNLDSTVFVGNIPLSSNHKTIKQYFSKYGKVLKVWFRSIPVEASKIPKKGLHILKKYQEGADSMNAYVKFSQQQEARAACEANGSEIQGKNIKVTLCKQFEVDFETTIFIGNLGRKIKDQDLWESFKQIGGVKSVRVIRNKQTFQCIGVGYVRFDKKEQMQKAIKEMNGKIVGQRPMRIKKAVSKQRLQKKVRNIKIKKQKKANPQIDKTGKGVKYNEDNNQRHASFSTNPLKNANYPNKKKRIFKNRDDAESPPDKNNFKKQAPRFEKNAVNVTQIPSDVIRSKFGFHGTKKSLQ